MEENNGTSDSDAAAIVVRDTLHQSIINAEKLPNSGHDHQRDADLNANIETTGFPAETSLKGLALTNPDSGTNSDIIDDPGQQQVTDNEGPGFTSATQVDNNTLCQATGEGINQVQPAVLSEMGSQSFDSLEMTTQELVTEDTMEQDNMIAMDNNIVVQHGELMETTEQHNEASTVVVATGEGSQYEIHMVSAEFSGLTEGLPEGTQLMTEDGQLIHAVQEDEHGNVVVLAEHPLSEIHTVHEQTETIIAENEEVSDNMGETVASLERDVVSEAAAEAQVTYVQEEVIEQQSEVVMLGEDAGFIVTEGESEELIVGEAPTLEVCAEAEISTSGADTPGVYPDDNMLGKYVPDEGQVVVQALPVPVMPQHRDQEVHHEEYLEEEEEDISYHEQVISESNHTIPNYDEEIQTLTEAANNSLRTMEQHYFPKKGRSRKKKIQNVADGVKPKRRRRPQSFYFDAVGEPLPGRSEALLRGLENLNLPVATAGTAPLSPAGSKGPPMPTALKPSSCRPTSTVQHALRLKSPELLMQMPTSAELVSPQKISGEMTVPRMVSPQIKLQPGLTSPSVASPLMISPRMLSPGTQGSQLSPRTISVTQKKHPLLSTILSVTSPGAQGLDSSVSPKTPLISPTNQIIRAPRNTPAGTFRFPTKSNVESQSQFPTSTSNIANTGKPNLPSPPPLLNPPSRPTGSVPHLKQQPQLTQVNAPNQFTTQQIQPLPHPRPRPQPQPQPPQQSDTKGLISRVETDNLSLPTGINAVRRQVFPSLQHINSNVSTTKAPVAIQASAVTEVPPVSLSNTMQPSITSQKSDDLSIKVVVQPKAGILASLPENEGATPENITHDCTLQDGASADSNFTDGTANESPPSQDVSETKPKLQELIKSELLAAAWESRQPVPAVSLTEKLSETKTAQLSPAAKEQPKSMLSVARLEIPSVPENSVSDSLIPVSTGLVTEKQRSAVDGTKVTTTVVPGFTLPPISTLQTKVPPGLVPSTVSLPIPSTGLNMPNVTAANRIQSGLVVPSTVVSSVPVSPPVADEKENADVLLGQIPVPRGALKSPVSSTGLGKDPMLSAQNLESEASNKTQQTSTQSSPETLKSPTNPLLAAARLPPPFPLAFAPGLPPVGLMMQPIPPVGFGLPGFVQHVRSQGDVLSFRPQSAALINPVTSATQGPATPQPASSTSDKQKIISPTLPNPPPNQPNPLDLIMEIMKKEMQGQPPKEYVRPLVPPQVVSTVKPDKGGLARFPTPGPTMEMLMAIMQREMAAAQIQAQVAAFHAAHAQAQAQVQASQTIKPASSEANTLHKPTKAIPSSQITQQLSSVRTTIAQPPAGGTVLPPVSTVIPSANVTNQLQDPARTVQPIMPQKPPQQQIPVTATNIEVTPNNVQIPSSSMQTQQRFVHNRTQSPNDTLADKYMKEWKPTGRFQCKFCYYSCVTQNFLFRHWVMNHCCMKPYVCAYCGLKSPTRDGITRHQTSKHKGHPRQVVIDATQEATLIQNFKALFNLEVKEIHPEDIRKDSLDGLQFPETFEPKSEKKSPVSGSSNGEHGRLSSVAEVNHVVKGEQFASVNQEHVMPPPGLILTSSVSSDMDQLPPHLREHFLATSASDVAESETGIKTSDYLKRHHKKSMIDALSSGGNNGNFTGPLSKEQLHAFAVAQAAEIDRSQAQQSKVNEPQFTGKADSLTTASPNIGTNSTSKSLPSIRDLIQMPRGQIFAMAGFGPPHNSQIPQSTQGISPQTFPSQSGVNSLNQSQLLAAESVTKSKTVQMHDAYTTSTVVPQTNTLLKEVTLVKPEGALPKLQTLDNSSPFTNDSEKLQSESEAHLAAAQLVSMANSRHVPVRHQQLPSQQKIASDQDQNVSAMVSNVAAAGEQQKAALRLEHEVAIQLEDFARRKAVQTNVSLANSSDSPQLQPTETVAMQRELSLDEQVALQLEEFRRRKAIIDAQEAVKPKKSPRAKSKKVNTVQSSHSAQQEYRHTGSSSVDDVVAQLHQIAQKKADDQARTAQGLVPSAPLTPTLTPAQQQDKQKTVSLSANIPQSPIDEQTLLASQLQELAQKRAAAVQAAIIAQANSSVEKKPVTTHIAEFPVMPKHNVGESVPVTTTSTSHKDTTMYSLYEKAVIESYEGPNPSKDTGIPSFVVKDNQESVPESGNEATTGAYRTQKDTNLATFVTQGATENDGPSSVPIDADSGAVVFEEGNVGAVPDTQIESIEIGRAYVEYNDPIASQVTKDVQLNDVTKSNLNHSQSSVPTISRYQETEKTSDGQPEHTDASFSENSFVNIPLEHSCLNEARGSTQTGVSQPGSVQEGDVPVTLSPILGNGGGTEKQLVTSNIGVSSAASRGCLTPNTSSSTVETISSVQHSEQNEN